MKSLELVKMAQEMSKVRSIYVLGCWGAPLTYGDNLERWSTKSRYEYNKKRTKMYSDAVAKAKADGVELFGGDCCGIVKGLLWGWCGDASKVYAGCNYGSNGMPDTTINAMLNTHCTDISDDFSNIQPGEFLVYDKKYGHCGLYLGDGLCLESTPKWDNCFQITEVWNIKKTQSKGRKWWKHGKFKIVDYTDYIKDEEENDTMKCPCCGKEIKVSLTAVACEAPSAPNTPVKKSNEELAKEVIRGLWGNGQARRDALTKAGYDPSAVQKIVNEMLK